MLRATRNRRIDTEYHELCMRELYSKDARVQAAAKLLVLAQAGVEIAPDAEERMQSGLADFDEQYRVSPDLMQRLLETAEPSLSQTPDKDLL